jgi:DNA-binding transcriptional LysR family regulator
MSSVNLSDMELFAAIVQHGGIRKAADNLALTRSTLSRRLTQLETRLGVRLIERNTRQFQITEAGRLYIGYCQQMTKLTQQAEWRLANFRDQPSGNLRITAPVNYGASVLQPVISQFIKAHPQVDVEVILDDGYLDIIEASVDVAIRLGPLSDSEMSARLIHTEKKHLCCSKAYALEHGVPSDPWQLEDHWCIRYGTGKDEYWQFEKGNQNVKLHPQGRIMVNDIAAMKQAVMGDMGITMLPGFLCEQEIADGTMLSLLEDWIFPDLPMYVLYPKRELIPKKTSAFIDFLLATFQ